MAEKLIHIFKNIFDLLFPAKCLGCGIKNEILCRKCLLTLPRFYEVKPRRTRVFAATYYQNEIMKKALRLLKYRGVKILAEPLAELIYQRLKEDKLYSKIERERHRMSLSACIIIPIPLSRKRMRKRGYNQAELIARCLSDKLSVKILTDVLYKIKETASQVEIKNREKRLKNLEGAFKVEKPETIAGKIIILVDDISTTGATINEASQTLKTAGAKRVIGVVVARG